MHISVAGASVHLTKTPGALRITPCANKVLNGFKALSKCIYGVCWSHLDAASEPFSAKLFPLAVSSVARPPVLPEVELRASILCTGSVNGFGGLYCPRAISTRFNSEARFVNRAACDQRLKMVGRNRIGVTAPSQCAGRTSKPSTIFSPLIDKTCLAQKLSST